MVGPHDLGATVSAVTDKHEFLSPSWIAAARQLRADHPTPAVTAAQALRANLVVTDAPFDDDAVRAHIDTTSGELHIDEGHLDGPDLTLTIDWSTAKAIFVGQDMQAAMTALIGGKVKIDGDAMKLLSMPIGAPDPGHKALAQRLSDLTA